MDQDRERAKESLKNMSGKEKIVHLWRYYRIPVIVACIVIGACISLIGQMTFNKRPDGCLQIGIRSFYVDPDAIDALPEYLKTKYPDMTENGEKAFYVEQYYAGYKDYEAEEANTVYYKLAGSVAAGTTDVLIGDLVTLEEEASMQVYMDLRDVFTEEELQRIEELAAPRTEEEGQSGIVYLTYDIAGANGRTETRIENVPYLICISDGDEKVDACAADRVTYLAIIHNTTNLDNVKTFIWSLLGENVD